MLSQGQMTSHDFGDSLPATRVSSCCLRQRDSPGAKATARSLASGLSRTNGQCYLVRTRDSQSVRVHSLSDSPLGNDCPRLVISILTYFYSLSLKRTILLPQ